MNIYEGDTEVRTAGAGITIWPRTWAVMRHLGLAEDLARVTVQSSGTVQPERQDTDYSRSGLGQGTLKGTAERRSGPAFVARKANQSTTGYTYARVLAPSKA